MGNRVKSFAGKVAAITGAGSGMGRGLALALASRGCHVAVCDVQADNLAETARQVEALGGVNCTSHVVDVADRFAVESFAADVAKAHGKVNMIFNNAGVTIAATVEDVAYDDFEWLMNINFWGVVYGTKAFLPYLREAGEGHVVNTSSLFGLMSSPTQSAYHSAKFAVKGFTDTLRIELAATDIGVSCVMPGGVKTDIVRSARFRISDNQAPTHEEVTQQFESLAGLTSDAAAEWILKGVQKNKARILVGRDAQVIAFLLRLFPVSYLRFIAWGQRRAERKRAAA